MINWIRRKLGLCVHDWRDWRDVYTAWGDGMPIGKSRACRKCPEIQHTYYPDGH